MLKELFALAAPIVNGDELHIPHATAGPDKLQTILQIVSVLLGSIALLFITIDALRYVFSQGDANKTARAKNGILYALVGLVICISAFTIVTYVLFNAT